MKRFRIAFSFSGEKRNFVAEVARILAEIFGDDKILYDKYHQAEFAQANLGFTLPKLYHDSTDLIVTVFCKDYQHKEWCGLEWRAIFDLIKSNRVNDVMLTRFDYVEVAGLFSISGFIELQYETPESTALLILERLAISEGRDKDYYVKNFKKKQASIVAIKHNLPSLQPFFGRSKELDIIFERIEPKSGIWGIVISGPGGIGKTSLAIYAALSMSEKGFERIIYVSLVQRELDDDGVRDMSIFLVSGLQELFYEIATELKFLEMNKASENERPRLLLEKLRSTKALLVLDNVESLLKNERDVLLTFLRKLPVGCKAIVTSRERIGVSVENLVLGEIEKGAALDMVTQFSKYNRLSTPINSDESSMLYTETGGKPLLIRWTIGQIGRGKCRNIKQAIAYLRSCPNENNPLEFIFGHLLNKLNDTEICIACVLTFFTMGVKADQVATITGCNAQSAEDALHILSNHYLVIPNESSETYALVPLVSDLLAKQKMDVILQMNSRLKEVGRSIILDESASNSNTHSKLEGSWPIISAALPLMLLSSNNEVQQLYSNLLDFLEFSGRWDELLILSNEAEKKALSVNDFLNAGSNVYDAGWVHYLRRQASAVFDCADRAESHWKLAGYSDHQQAVIFRLRGLGYKISHNYDQAKKMYIKAINLWRAVDKEGRSLAKGLNSLADIENLLGEYDDAEKHYKKALEIAKLIMYEEGQAIYTGSWADMELNRQNWIQAEILGRDALALSQRVGRVELIAFAALTIAKSLFKQNKKDKAYALANHAFDIYTKIGSPDATIAESVMIECKE